MTYLKAASGRRLAAALAVTVMVLALLLGGYAPAQAQAAEGGPVGALDEVESAVIQIEAVGSFADPVEGMQRNTAGFGSGFIIDPSGIAVTNNHVVTGGALYKVYVAGRDKPVNAKVLGVSECSDLAVIDLQGEGYPYLGWYEGNIRVGLDVYAAGFPLGDPEFTLTRGIVSKANADGESGWASVDRVIQHDAAIHGGNSGGPLVSEDGQVVGVNYAGGPESDQNYAIAADNARPIVDRLAAGENVDSLGLNAEAFDDGEDNFGVWVYSVESGSPADGAGIEPGDIVLSIEGVDVGAGGVMTDYCDIVSSHDANDVLAVQVYRPDTKEVLEGQFNGRPLAASINVAENVESDTALPPAQGAAAGEPTYVQVSDEAGTFTIEVPQEWSEVQERPWVVAEEEVGHQLIATTDLEKFFEEWGIPGVVFSYSDTAQESYTPEELLDQIDYSEVCSYIGRKELPADAYYTGGYDEYEACGDSGAAAIIFAMTPKEGDFLLGIELYAVTEADLTAIDHLLDTFIIGTAGGDSLLDLFDTSGLEYEYAELNEEALGALVPADWSDIAVGDWVDEDDQKIGVYVDAAVDLKEYNDYWGVAGLTGYSTTEFGAGEDPADRLPEDIAACTFVEEGEHEHTVFGITYTGVYRAYDNCEESKGTFYRLSAAGGEGDTRHLVRIDFVAVDAADQEAWEVLLETFYVPGVVGSTAPAPDEPTINTDEYAEIASEAGEIRVAVPTTWADVDSGVWEIDGEPFGSYLTAAPSLADYEKSWNVPGMWLGLTDQLSGADLGEILDTIALGEECTLDARYDYEGENFGGSYDLWTECGGGADNQAATFALYPLDNDQLTVVASVSFNAEEGAAALDRLLITLDVSGAAGAATDAGGGDRSSEEGNAPESAPESTPESAPESAAPAEIYVTINTATLNVRSGPGTNYERIATINQGATLLAIGQFGNCSWLQIEDADGEQGWVSGNAQYTALEGDCADLPEVAAPPATGSSGQPGGQASGQSGAPAAAGGSGQACVNFVNQTGEDLTITFTRKSDNWNTAFQIGKGASKQQCVDAGKYALTVNTVFGGELNQDIELAAGERFDWPLHY